MRKSYFRDKVGLAVAEVYSEPRKRKYIKIVSPSLNYIFQSDLLFYKNKIILTTIDIFSRRAYSILIPNKQANSVKKAFQKTIKYLGKPNVVMVDGGGEFKREFLNYLKSSGIEVRVSGNDSMRYKSIKTKQGISERYNRTVKNLLNSYLLIEQKTNFGQRDLDIINDDYNNHKHSSINFTPNEIVAGALPKNRVSRNIKNTSLEIGDSVRILLQRGVFEKNSKTKRSYSNDIYYIMNSDGNRYQISNHEWYPYTRLKISKMVPTVMEFDKKGGGEGEKKERRFSERLRKKIQPRRSIRLKNR